MSLTLYLLWFLQVVRYHLLDQISNKLMEKRQAENSGMVTDYQVPINLQMSNFIIVA